DRTPAFVSARCSRRCGASSIGSSRDSFRNDDLHLRARKMGQTLGERNVVVPRGDDSDPRRPAADGQLAVPAPDIVARSGQPLAATAVTKPAHPADHGLLECGRVVPPCAREMPWRRLERPAEAEPRVGDGDDDDPAAEPLRPSVALYGDPAALTRV